MFAVAKAPYDLTRIGNEERADGEQAGEPIPVERVESIVKEFSVERALRGVGGFSKNFISFDGIGLDVFSEFRAFCVGAFGERAQFGCESFERL